MISCIDECAAEDEEDDDRMLTESTEPLIRQLLEDSSILGLSSSAVNYQQSHMPILKQALFKYCCSGASGATVESESSQNIEFLSPNHTDNGIVED